MTKKVRVLVVDDSAFARFAIAKRIRTDVQIEVVGQARDGFEAVDMTKNLKPDVVTMDVTMPRMDGLEAVKEIMAECPTPVVMLSALTREGADVTIRALEMGAVDFFLKPSVVSPVGSGEASDELINKIKAASEIDPARLKVPPKTASKSHKKTVEKPPASEKGDRGSLRKIVVIGSSTGGPRALNQIIPTIPGDLPAGVLIVQHMPSGFTKSLAERLNESSPLEVREAMTGDVIAPGLVLLAPGGFHMTVDSHGMIELNEGPQECGLRPAANVTMQTAADAFGDFVLGVVLTGMGSDGTRGCQMIKEAGGQVLVEHEMTCVVYGMPKSVVEAGFVDKILPLPQIPIEIIKRCEASKKVLHGFEAVTV